MSEVTQEVTLEDALVFIEGAEETDLERIIDAIKWRRKTLARRKAAAVQVGMEVVTEGLSPRYLNGLTGTVEAIHRNRADVRLTEESTDTLRFSGKRFYVNANVTQHLLQGVPLQCCKPTNA